MQVGVLRVFCKSFHARSSSLAGQLRLSWPFLPQLPHFLLLTFLHQLTVYFYQMLMAINFLLDLFKVLAFIDNYAPWTTTQLAIHEVTTFQGWLTS